MASVSGTGGSLSISNPFALNVSGWITNIDGMSGKFSSIDGAAKSAEQVALNAIDKLDQSNWIQIKEVQFSDTSFQFNIDDSVTTFNTDLSDSQSPSFDPDSTQDADINKPTIQISSSSVSGKPSDIGEAPSLTLPGTVSSSWNDLSGQIDTDIPELTIDKLILQIEKIQLQDITIEDYTPVTMSIGDAQLASTVPRIESLDFNETEYTSALYNALCAAISAKLVSVTGFGVEDTQYEQAKYALDFEYEDSWKKAMAMHAASGFGIPTGMLAGVLLDIEEQYDFKLYDANNKIMTENAEAAENDWQNAVKSGVQLESILAEFFKEHMARLIKAAAATYQTYWQFYQNILQYDEIQMQKLKLQMKLREVESSDQLNKLEAVKLQLIAEKQNIDDKRIDLADVARQLNAYEVYSKYNSVKIGLAKELITAEQLKVEDFKSKMENYATSLKAAQMQLKNWALSVQSGAQAIDIYAAEVEENVLLNREVEIRNSLREKWIDAVDKNNQIRIDKYLQEIKKYQVSLDGYFTQKKAWTKGLAIKKDTYADDVNLNTQMNAAKTELEAARLRDELREKTKELNNQRLQIEQDLVDMRNNVDRLTARASLYSSFLQTKVSGMNLNAYVNQDISDHLAQEESSSAVLSGDIQSTKGI